MRSLEGKIAYRIAGSRHPGVAVVTHPTTPLLAVLFLIVTHGN